MYSQQEEINKIVEQDMEKLEYVLLLSKDFKMVGTTVKLFGSYGRGEGGGIEGKPVNDYDILVVNGSEKLKEELESLELSVPVEVHLEKIPTSCTQQWYEISKASHHLAGTKVELPEWEPWDIPYSDAINSIDRRVASMLVGKYEMMKKEPDWHKALTQICKMIFALGDATLIKRGQFAPSYRTRSLMLMQDPISNLYQLATSFKILGTPHLSSDRIWALWGQVQGMVRSYLIDNELRTQFGDLLGAIDESVKSEDLKSILVKMGSEKWL